MPLGARLWYYAAELCTLSVEYPLCSSALTNTTDNMSEMCSLKLTNFCLFLCHQSYTILQGPLIPTTAFTSWYDQGPNRLPPRWESQHSNYKVTPNCFSCVASCNIMMLSKYLYLYLYLCLLDANRWKLFSSCLRVSISKAMSRQTFLEISTWCTHSLLFVNSQCLREKLNKVYSCKMQIYIGIYRTGI